MSVSRRCICGRDVWGKTHEALGPQPMHACCRIWLTEHDAEACRAKRRRGQECAACRGDCPACLSSDAARREHKRRVELRLAEERKQAAIDARERARKDRAEARQAKKHPIPPPPPRRRFADAVAATKEIHP